MAVSRTPAGIEFADPVLEMSLRDGLRQVEDALRRSVDSDYAFVT